MEVLCGGILQLNEISTAIEAESKPTKAAPGITAIGYLNCLNPSLTWLPSGLIVSNFDIMFYLVDRNWFPFFLLILCLLYIAHLDILIIGAKTLKSNTSFKCWQYHTNCIFFGLTGIFSCSSALCIIARAFYHYGQLFFRFHNSVRHLSKLHSFH